MEKTGIAGMSKEVRGLCGLVRGRYKTLFGKILRMLSGKLVAASRNTLRLSSLMSWKLWPRAEMVAIHIKEHLVV